MGSKTLGWYTWDSNSLVDIHVECGYTCLCETMVQVVIPWRTVDYDGKLGQLSPELAKQIVENLEVIDNECFRQIGN